MIASTPALAASPARTQESGILSGIRLGIDIGGTKTALALGDEAGAILGRARQPTKPSSDPAADLGRIAKAARELARECDIALTDLECVGVSLPGPLDGERQCVLSPANLSGWGEVPVVSLLAAEFELPIRLENDANAAALAEARYGAGQGMKNVVYLTMSTGIGGGLVLDGALYTGAHHAAGEIGHAPVAWPGEPCVCGLRGCLEAYAGGAAWQRRLRATAPQAGEVARLAGGRDAITPEHAVRAAHAGDAYAVGELDRLTDYLARAIVPLQFTLAPDAILLGTIAVAAGEELFLAPLREKVRARSWAPPAFTSAIRLASLGEELPYRAGLCAAG